MELIFLASVILLPVIICLLYFVHRRGQSKVPVDRECGLSLQKRDAVPPRGVHPVGLPESQDISIQVLHSESVGTWKQSHVWQDMYDGGISNIAYESGESIISVVLSEKSLHDLHNDHINTHMQSVILHDIYESVNYNISFDHEESFSSSILSDKSSHVPNEDTVCSGKQSLILQGVNEVSDFDHEESLCSLVILDKSMQVVHDNTVSSDKQGIIVQDVNTNWRSSIKFYCDETISSSIQSDKSIFESSQELNNDPVSAWVESIFNGFDNLNFNLDESLISSVNSEKSLCDLPNNPNNYLTFNCNESRTSYVVPSEEAVLSLHNDIDEQVGPVSACENRIIWQDLCSDDNIEPSESFISVLSEISLLELSCSEFHTDNCIRYCYKDGFFITIHLNKCNIVSHLALSEE